MATKKATGRRGTRANPVTATKGLRAVRTPAQAEELDRRLVEAGSNPVHLFAPGGP